MSGPIVIKVGGALTDDPQTVAALYRAVAELCRTHPVVVVHGGGPQTSRLSTRLGHTPRLVAGRRVTGDVDLECLVAAVRGGVSTTLVTAAYAAGVRAVGLSGADAGMVRVHRRPPWHVDGDTVDFGHVGDVEGVDPTPLTALLAAGLVPLVAPLGVDGEGHVYNVNADTVALAVAVALGAERLLLVSEAGACRRDPADASTRLPRCDAETLARGEREGWIEGGMRVKLRTALDARAAGVTHVALCRADDVLACREATWIH